MKLDHRIGELIAVGASVAAGCQPCLKYHVKHARESEAGQEEITEAIEIGKMVRRGAATNMDRFVAELSQRITPSVHGTNDECGAVHPHNKSQKVKMDKTQFSSNKLKRVAWGLLAILWGTTILFDFIPFGIGLIGSGLILIGVNIIRAMNNLSIENDNGMIGTLALAWGGLELGRPFLRQLFPSADLDWVIFAILLVGFGAIVLVPERLRIRKAGFGESHLGTKE